MRRALPEWVKVGSGRRVELGKRAGYSAGDEADVWKGKGDLERGSRVFA